MCVSLLLLLPLPSQHRQLQLTLLCRLETQTIHLRRAFRHKLCCNIISQLRWERESYAEIDRAYPTMFWVRYCNFEHLPNLDWNHSWLANSCVEMRCHKGCQPMIRALFSSLARLIIVYRPRCALIGRALKCCIQINGCAFIYLIMLMCCK